MRLGFINNGWFITQYERAQQPNSLAFWVLRAPEEQMVWALLCHIGRARRMASAGSEVPNTQIAQKLGKKTWYQDYSLRVAGVKRSYVK